MPLGARARRKDLVHTSNQSELSFRVKVRVCSVFHDATAEPNKWTSFLFPVENVITGRWESTHQSVCVCCIILNSDFNLLLTLKNIIASNLWFFYLCCGNCLVLTHLGHRIESWWISMNILHLYYIMFEYVVHYSILSAFMWLHVHILCFALCWPSECKCYIPCCGRFNLV